MLWQSYAVVSGTASLLGTLGLIGGSAADFINIERIVATTGADTINGNGVLRVFADYASAASGVQVNLAAGTGVADGATNTLDQGGTERRSADFSASGDGSVTLTYATGFVNVLRNVEEVDFVDGREIFDVTAPVTQVVRLYQAALDRVSEQAGLNFYASVIERGATLATIARDVLGSPEFQVRYGVSLPAEQYIARLYANVLDRAPSTGEVGFCRDLLACGTTRDQLLVKFSEGPENIAKTAPPVADGIWDISENAPLVARLYATMFGRLPDVAGLDYY